MMKTVLIASAVLFAAPPAGQVTDAESVETQQTIMNLPETEAVIAQFSYLQLSHDVEGFSLAITDTTAIFVDLEFPGEFHIRIGF